MNRLACLASLIALGFAGFLAAEEKKNELPSGARTILEKAESFELYSVESEQPRKEPTDKTKLFRGHLVLGKTAVKNAEVRKRIREALLKGIANHPENGAKCFLPRHGLRASYGGKSVDLLICFECLRISAWNDGKQSDLLTARSAQSVLDKVLKDAGVPLAKELGK